MKEGLILIKHEIDEDDYYSYDIEHLKIYFDCDKGQYRHRFECPSCGKPTDCFCFNELSDAVSAAEEQTLYCGDCYIQAQLDELLYEDFGVQELIDECEGTHIQDQIELVNMIEFNEIYSRATPEYKEERITELKENVNQVISNLKPETLEKLHTHFIENCDWDDFAGSSCNSE